MESSSKKLNIVYFMRFEWDSSFRRPYHLEMSKHVRMLGVELPMTIDFPLRNWSIFIKWLKQKSKLRKINHNLHVYRPLSLVCYYLSFRLPFLSSLNRRILLYSLKPILKKLEMNDPIVIISHPMMEYVIGALNEKALCYEVFDEYSEDHNLSPRMKRRLLAVEKRVMQNTDIVFTSSVQQMKTRVNFARHVYCVPNAVDFEHFKSARNSDMKIPGAIQVLPSPRLCLIGNINKRLDTELIKRLARHFSEGSIVIIGRKEINTSEIQLILDLPNVHYLGFKDYAELPSFMKGIDVGLLLYRIDAHTQGIYPNKLHQYLAAGKPVVSTPMPELEKFKDIIGWAQNHDDFIAKVNEALTDKNNGSELRINIASENSIANRTLEKIIKLRECLK